MPTDVFKTRKGQPVVEIPGIGLVDDEDGVPLKRAALSMTELQHDDGKPLTGAALVSAAKEWADRAGLTVGKGIGDSEDDPAAAAAAATAETTNAAQAAAETKE